MVKPVFEVISDRDRAFAFALKFYSIKRTPDQKGLCLLRDGVVQAAVLYDEFNGSNIFMHVAARPGSRWMTRDFLKWAFHYPFEQLRVRRISGWVDANNIAAIRLNEHLGFRREAVLESAAPEGGDVFIYVMTREDCRYV